MRNQRFSKAALFFLELSVAVLALAVCAAICLSAFASADSVSRKSQQQNQAALLLQTEAEQFRAEAGNALPSDSESWYDHTWQPTTSPQPDGFRLQRSYKVGENGVETAEFSVWWEQQPEETLFSLTAARYHSPKGGGDYDG